MAIKKYRASKYLTKYIIAVRYTNRLLETDIENIERLKQLTKLYFKKVKLKLLDLELRKNCVILTIDAKPQVLMSSLVNSYKTNISRFIKDTLKLAGESFWGGDYLILTIDGGIVEEVIESYLEGKN